MTTARELVVDTDLLIDVGRGIPEAVIYLREKQQHYRLCLSTITYLELLIGAQNKTELRKIDRFVARFELLRLSEAIADRGTQLIRQYRLSHGLLLADGLIAATALELGLPLATKNQRHYRFIAGLLVLPYP
jgi:predicted nucleic acid-binding protein